MRRLALLVCLLGVPLLAQPPRGFFPWWDSPVAKDLNLSEDQTKQIRTVVREYRSKLIDQRAAVEKAEGEFEDQFNDELFDQRRAGDALERLITARGDMTRSLSQMSLRLRAVLTADQYKELQKRRPGMQPGQIRRDLMQKRRQDAPGNGQRRQQGGPNGPPPNQPPPNQQHQ
ncbi:MAG: periplasmic heavy metal sensor [Bryobacterales bacterium]|nr:periplasmic heavy metal sensor [Bryobacterales bacterium]